MDRMHTHASCMHMVASCTCIMHMHASYKMLTHATCSHACNMHRVRVFGLAFKCVIIQGQIDIICDPDFTDEQFNNVEGIELARPNARDYDPNIAAFHEIPPHHIVIQGKYLRVIHWKMQDQKCLSKQCRLKIAGTFAMSRSRPQRVWHQARPSTMSSCISNDDTESFVGTDDEDRAPEARYVNVMHSKKPRIAVRRIVNAPMPRVEPRP